MASLKCISRKNYLGEATSMSGVRCNLCPQGFDNKDPLFFNCLMRHEDHHDPKMEHGCYNQTWGEVKWIPLR